MTLWLGIDPGKDMGVALVSIERTIGVRQCRTFHDVEWLHDWVKIIKAEGVYVAIETWEYQGAQKSRGVPHQAEAYGRVAGALEILEIPYVSVKRGQVLQSLGLQRSSKKAVVRAAVRSLTSGDRPRNDHEADAVATAIAGAGRVFP